jgi:hypothetical protein
MGVGVIPLLHPVRQIELAPLLLYRRHAEDLRVIFRRAIHSDFLKIFAR